VRNFLPLTGHQRDSMMRPHKRGGTGFARPVHAIAQVSSPSDLWGFFTPVGCSAVSVGQTTGQRGERVVLVGERMKHHANGRRSQHPFLERLAGAAAPKGPQLKAYLAWARCAHQRDRG